MTAPVTLQADALLAAIAQQRDAECRAVRERAEAEAEAIERQARDKALRERRRAAAALHEAARQRLLHVAAGLDADDRQAAAERAREAIVRLRPRLEQALSARWRDPAARRAWVEAVAAVAGRRLAPTGRVLRHPATMPDDEVSALAARLGARAQAEPSLGAGLRIEADGAWVDATPAALLADRQHVDAMLRAALDEETAP